VFLFRGVDQSSVLPPQAVSDKRCIAPTPAIYDGTSGVDILNFVCFWNTSLEERENILEILVPGMEWWRVQQLRPLHYLTLAVEERVYYDASYVFADLQMIVQRPMETPSRNAAMTITYSGCKVVLTISTSPSCCDRLLSRNIRVAMFHTQQA
jgi:hypothetical protein